MGELVKYKNSNRKALPVKADDLKAIVTMTCESIKRRGITQVIFPDTEEGLQAFMDGAKEYFQMLTESDGLLPGVEGLCVHLGISRQSLFGYEKRGGNWTAAIQYIKTCIASAKQQLAQTGRIPPIIFVFDMVNNYNFVNTNQVRISRDDASEGKQRSNAELLESLKGAIVEEAEADPDDGGTF